jgi:uncharacterized protein (TIGR02145 family)
MKNRKKIRTSVLASIITLASLVAGVVFVTSQQPTEAIQINQISPTSGDIVGGETVTITGDFALSVSNLTYMQEMTQEYCDSMPVYRPGDTPVTLPDIRDGKIYEIRKLVDNKCWMVDNLRLELKPGMTLTPDDTNVQTDTTIYFTNDATALIPSTASGAALTGMIGNFTTSGYMSKTGTSSLGTNQYAWRQSNPSGDVSFGYLYNWYTAVAGVFSGGSSASICPAGWRLPTGGASPLSEISDFGILHASMLNGVYTVPGNVNGTAAARANWAPSGVFKIVKSGYRDNSYREANVTAFIWTATLQGQNPFAFSYDDSNVQPGANQGGVPIIGAAVRCVTNSTAPAAPTVTIDGVAATVTAYSDTSITITTPSHVAGLVDVVVTRDAETITLTDGYEYVDNSVAPPVNPPVNPPVTPPGGGGDGGNGNNGNNGGGSNSGSGSSGGGNGSLVPGVPNTGRRL